MDSILHKKGNNTKTQILSKAKTLFSKYGYTSITMKDICEACQLSRGGLYRYFSSTKQIFIEILLSDKEDKNNLLEKEINENKSAIHILNWFLCDRKNHLMLGDNRGFSFAIQEFVRSETDQSEFILQRYNQAKEALKFLFTYGQNKNEFFSFDCDTMAAFYLFHLDSLEINAYPLNCSENEINAQLDFLLNLVVKTKCKYSQK